MATRAPTPVPDLEALSAEELIGHLVERFHPRLYVACSLQKESSVLIDMIVRIEPSARLFLLDTDVLFPETYATLRAIEERYGVTVDVYRGISLEQQAAEHGDALWARDPDRCCSLRKVAPLEDALAGVDAWITGLRREQSPTRAQTRKFGWDLRHGVWKAAPLADWSEQQIWDYLAEHDVPYNPLHDEGYGSIGCTHCTLPGAGRSGRWAGTSKLECGLHPA